MSKVYLVASFWTNLPLTQFPIYIWMQLEIASVIFCGEMNEQPADFLKAFGRK
jgi:hypothetical protein